MGDSPASHPSVFRKHSGQPPDGPLKQLNMADLLSHNPYRVNRLRCSVGPELIFEISSCQKCLNIYDLIEPSRKSEAL